MVSRCHVLLAWMLALMLIFGSPRYEGRPDAGHTMLNSLLDDRGGLMIAMSSAPAHGAVCSPEVVEEVRATKVDAENRRRYNAAGVCR